MKSILRVAQVIEDEYPRVNLSKGRRPLIRSRLLTRSGIFMLSVLCCAGLLGIRLLISIFPVIISSPEPDIGRPLGGGEVIAFSYMRIDVLRPFELYLLDDANGLRSLSQGLKRSDIGPVWSPDGSQLVYQSVSGWATRYYLVAADGGHRREITPDDRPKGLLRWSPDGSLLAYLTYHQNSDGSISNSAYLCVTEVATGDTHQAPVGNVQDLVWTPDGRSLLAVVRTDDSVALDKYDANGNHEGRISEADFLRDAATITISPDASKVAYIDPVPEGDVESGSDSLNISALDGSATKSFATLWTEASIVWSPDSTRIAFVALTSDYEYALYVADAAGAQMRELMLVNTGDESGETVPAAPAWSPDGIRIATSSLSSAEGPALFVMNADGTQRRQIISFAGNGMIYDLAWRPGE
jgi:Tol biopolymer transport system component